MQTSNKHIFIVTYDYPPSNGGIARLCFELKKYLREKRTRMLQSFVPKVLLPMQRRIIMW